MAELVLRNLVRRYGSVAAVSDVSLTVADGEFVTILGPSGCGKSTTLAMIAGLDKPDEGFISVGGKTFYDGAAGTYVNSEHRNLGLVFQSYALWPHMSVRENVAFPLRLRKVDAAKRDKAVLDALNLVEMGPFVDRYPNQLSGGQQQRVALARTLAYQPAMLLLDEPLSNLDAKLRDKARSWLRQLQTEVGITTIFVTHDQVEALALSDRIAVMNSGRIAQVGTPREIYEHPADAFVADFIGSSNFLKGEVLSAQDGRAIVRLADDMQIDTMSNGKFKAGDPTMVFFRPERVELRASNAGPMANVIPARISEETYIGSRLLYTAETSAGAIKFETLNKIEGRDIAVHIAPEHCAALPA
ncbi:MAG: ABC transporter ATP-binding protein [Burkholderiales bacterium]|nr:MAG: ABC transporter ATP-binding protein [Burkholderiales bacterium]